MNKLIEYKRDSALAFLPIFLSIGLGLLVLYIFRTLVDYKAIFVVCSFTTIFYLLVIASTPTRIVLDENDLTISIYDKLKSKPNILPPQEVSVSFQDEIKARGRKIKIFRIIHRNIIVVQLQNEQAGWRKNTLAAICDKINQLRTKPQNFSTIEQA